MKGNEAIHKFLPACGFIREAKAHNYWPGVTVRSTWDPLGKKCAPFDKLLPIIAITVSIDNAIFMAIITKNISVLH